MNREIKFRAWIPSRNEMLAGRNVRDIGMQWCWNSVDIAEAELMQFTGLKDIKGKEIYEGDFVKSVSLYPKGGQSETVYEIVFEEDELRFALSSQSSIGNDKRTESFGWWIGNDWNKLEVIGNVFENPELLK